MQAMRASTLEHPTHSPLVRHPNLPISSPTPNTNGGLVEPSAVLAHAEVLDLLGEREEHPSPHLVPVDSPLAKLRPPQQDMPPKIDKRCLWDGVQNRIPFGNPLSRPTTHHLEQKLRCRAGGSREALHRYAVGNWSFL